MELIISEKNDLKNLIEASVRDALSGIIPQTKIKTPQRLMFNDALDVLNENGFKITKGGLYKLTMTNEVPCKRFGRKIVFDRTELLEWVESQLITPKSNLISKSVAESANLKLGRA